MIGGRQRWAVRRWKSPVAGKVRLVGTFEGGAEGDGTEIRILVDGKQVHAALAGGKSGRADVELDLTVTVRKGSLVDFAVTPGPPGLNLSHDASGLNVRILKHGE